ncbi:aldo/keto reductase [Haloferula chungangensis]|uniref:Aldo/keto reductase n=1 Tax=Haloferula chungangensis TaxID=1048331 RepID=A0ABW2L6T9_9BACT
MRSVELVSGIHSSVLGFGCAPILGAVGRREADRALGHALDCGVTHFDIARSYGYGEAESHVGRFLAGRREELVIASKFGIRATWKAGLLRPLKPLVRTLKGQRKPAMGPPSSTEIQSTPKRDPFHQRIPLTPAAMQASLEQSLKALRTDYLDLFFLHEPLGAIERLDDLVEAAETLKQQGKVKGWGLAFDWASHSMVAPSFSRFEVLQFNNSPGSQHYAQALAARRDQPNVFFSPLRGAGGLKPNRVLEQMWSDFPNSVILCSMFKPEHITANAEAAGE